MNLLSLEIIQKNHRRELEQRLENADNNLKNLDRMAEEAFREIDRRASEDKEMLSKIFNTLTANEEVTISSLKEELGLVSKEELSFALEQELGPANSLNDEYSTQGQVHVKAKKNGGKKDAAV